MKKFKPLIVVAVIVVIIAIITACIAKEENGRAVSNHSTAFAQELSIEHQESLIDDVELCL